MSLALRILLIAVSLLTFVFMVIRIRKTRLQISDSVFWIVLALILIVVAIFPSLITSLSAFLGVQSAANFVFLVIIFVLILKIFFMSMRMSMLDVRIRELAQHIALSEAGVRVEEREPVETKEPEVSGD